MAPHSIPGRGPVQGKLSLDRPAAGDFACKGLLARIIRVRGKAPNGYPVFRVGSCRDSRWDVACRTVCSIQSPMLVVSRVATS